MTLLDSLPLTDPPPADRAGIEAWLTERADAIAARTRARLREIVHDAYAGFVDSLTAAGDLTKLDQIPSQWMAFVEDELAPIIGTTHLSGSLQAWLGSGIETHHVHAQAWLDTVNQNAVSFQDEASNRLAGVGDAVWHDVRSQTVSAIKDGATNEELKGQIEGITGFSEYRADTIARTETVSAYVNGDMAGARALGDKGPVEKVWVATLDKRTRETHAEAHNQTVLMEAMFDVGGVMMDAPHDPGAPPSEVVNCRCYVEQLYVGDSRPDGSTVEDPNAAPPEPDRWEPPSYEGSTLRTDPSAPSLGGGHAKMVLKDEAGNRYLFKPMDQWVAHGESMASHIGHLGGLNDLPMVMVHQHEGQWGSLQQLIKDARPGFKGAASGFDPLLVTKADRELMMQHRALDWLTSQHDAHAENWIREGYASQGGQLHGIDKGQAFKLLGKDELSYKFNPNAVYGQSAPVYNFIEESFAKGRLQGADELFSAAKTKPVGKVIAKLQQIPDADYRAILRPYAEGRFAGSPHLVERFLDTAVERKNQLDAEFQRYFRKLGTERKAVLGPKIVKPSVMGGAGGPTGMHTAIPSEPTDAFMARHDHPLPAQAEGGGYLSTELQAVQTYTGGTYDSINGALREGKDHRLAAPIRSQLKPVKSDILVKRGANLTGYIPNGDMAALPGTVIRDRSFLSTSAGNKAAFSGDTLLNIKVTAGTPGAWIKPVSLLPSENEFLLADNTPMYVHSVRLVDPALDGEGVMYRYTWVAEVEVVSDQWALANSRIWDTNLKTWVTS